MTPTPLKALAIACLFAIVSTPSDAAKSKIISFKDDPHSRSMPVYQTQPRSISPGPGLYQKRKAVKAKRFAVPLPAARMSQRTQPARSVGISASTLRGYADHVGRGSVSLAGIVPELAYFARSVMADCGSKVISALRNTRVRGSGAVSLHAFGRAIDIAGNPDCIRKHLAGWGGGASNDYHRIRPNHYHVSWGGREHGKRFAHYTGRKIRRTRYAAAR